MVGKAVTKCYAEKTQLKILSPSRKEVDLREYVQVDNYFEECRPDYVLMIAAKVGGIAANKADPVGFMAENTRLQQNLFEACHKYDVKKALFLGSSCIYPRDCPQPMKEEYLLTGPLEPTNEGYALAKIMGLKLALYYFQQYDRLTVCPMPCNIYGTNDHFDLKTSHVLSALVRRFVDAKDEEKPDVTMWGTGSARREFIHVDDVADAIHFFMEQVETPEHINLGTGTDVSIFELANLIAELVDYQGELKWDSSMPDGMPRKCLDISRLTALGFQPRVELRDGIKRTIAEYRQLKSQGLV
jgi:GDP-L-fucose synthase